MWVGRCVCVYIYTCMYVGMLVGRGVCVCMYVYIYVCIYVYVNVCMYIPALSQQQAKDGDDVVDGQEGEERAVGKRCHRQTILGWTTVGR